LTSLDLLIDATIDWASTKARAAEKLFAAVTIVIDALHSGTGHWAPGTGHKKSIQNSLALH
jgi:hypothetical protein